MDGVGSAVGVWTDLISQSVVGLNLLGLEAITMGRSTPVIAGNTFVSGGDNGLHLNFSYGFRLVAQQYGVVDCKPMARLLFVDRASAKAQNFCFSATLKEIPPFVSLDIEFVSSEGLPVPLEYLL